MRKMVLASTLIGFVLLAGCASGGGVFGRKGPNEFEVGRAAPLVVPPDFALTPPKPGAPRPQEADSSTQALQAMFGGAATRSDAEKGALSSAGANRAQGGIRSDAGDPDTTVVDKGAVTRDVIAAPEGDGQNAKTSTPQ